MTGGGERCAMAVGDGSGEEGYRELSWGSRWLGQVAADCNGREVVRYTFSV